MIKGLEVSESALVKQTDGNIVSDMDGEKVMLSIENGKYYNLGEIGGEIWSRIQEPIFVYELIGNLTHVYDIERHECSNQVVAFLKHLLDEKLIQITST